MTQRLWETVVQWTWRFLKALGKKPPQTRHSCLSRNIWYSPLMTVTRQIDQIRCVHPWCPWPRDTWCLPTLVHQGGQAGNSLAPPHVLLLLQEELFSSMSFHITHFANSITEIACSHFERLIHIMGIRGFQYTANYALVCSQEKNASPN